MGALLFRDSKRHDMHHRAVLKNSEETSGLNTEVPMGFCRGSIDFSIDTTMSKERQ
jgi:hypothetical protein